MKVSCPSCQSTLSIDDKKVPAGGARIKCPTCQHVFPVKAAARSASATVPLPGAQGPAATAPAVPLPGGPSFAAAAAQGFTAPSADGSSIPLPGRASTGWSGDSVPLPGSAIPGATAVVAPPSNAGRSRASQAVPLPGMRAAAPEPFAAAEELTRGGGDLTSTSSVFDLEFGEEPAPSPAGPGSGQSDAVALPGARWTAPQAPAAPRGGGAAIPLPGAAQEESLDFDVSGPSQVLSQPSFTGLEPPPPAFSFDAPPAPDELGAPGSFDFGGASGGHDLTAAGSQAAPDFSFEASAPPAPASVSFGEVELGQDQRRQPTGDLEFDPGLGERAPDDLEADLSAPIPAPAAPSGPADGLEMLSFIDDQAREAGATSAGPSAVRRFHIKRRSGKVFGPFEEAVIVKMLEEGQLLGNEEVSLDTETWQPVGGEPVFQTVIARLMEAPTSRESVAPPTVNAGIQDERAKGPSMERLKQLYEGRMAAVAVVQGKEPVPFKKRLPWILGGAGLAAVLITGLSLGLATPYGFFALKLLFPGKVRPDTREFGYLEEARRGFQAGTWKGFSGARDQAAAALAIKEFPEARAVWCQAVFHLDRRYGKATPADLEQARRELVNVKLLGDKHPEVLKTLAAEALDRRAPDEALVFLNDALARASDDVEAYFLRSEAYLQKKQPQQAKGELEQVLKLKPKSARALHALGLLARSGGDTAEAGVRFQAALEADPRHLASALELAELAIIGQKDVARGSPFLDRALAKEAFAQLSVAEQGKALALKAETLVVLGKIQEAVPIFEEALATDPSNSFTQARLGRVYLELHDPDKAVALLQKAVASTPDSLDYAAGYLSALIAVGRMDDARKVVQQTTTRFPGNAMLAYLSGRVSDALDNPKEAEEAYKRALAADPGIADAYLYLARLFMRFRRFNEARPQLETGLEKAPSNASLRMGLGELHFMERDLEGAEREFKAAVELDVSLAEAHLGLSRVSLERGKADLAETQVERALEINPRITGGKLQQGIALWKLGRLEDAIAVLEKARDEEPKNLQVRVTLGAVAFDKGDLDGALKYLNAALVAEPGHADGNFYLARVQNAQRNHTQAIEAMKRALDFNGNNPVYHYWMGRIFADAHKPDDALAEWKAALTLDGDYADALEALGKAYYERSDYKRAVRNYQAALKSDPTRASVRLEIGDAQMKQDDWDGAILSYQQALTADRTLKTAYAQLGQAYEEKRQPKKAIEQYLRAVAADDNTPDAWRQLGWLYKTTGKKKDATQAFKKYLSLKPDAEDKKQIEDELEFIK